MVVAPVHWVNTLLCTDRQCLKPLGYLVLHPIQLVLPSGQNVCQLHGCRPTPTNSSPVPVSRKVFVQHFGKSHMLNLRLQNRYVIYSFVGYSQVIGHPDSLPHFQNLVKI